MVQDLSLPMLPEQGNCLLRIPSRNNWFYCYCRAEAILRKYSTTHIDSNDSVEIGISGTVYFILGIRKLAVFSIVWLNSTIFSRNSNKPQLRIWNKWVLSAILQPVSMNVSICISVGWKESVSQYPINLNWLQKNGEFSVIHINLHRARSNYNRLLFKQCSWLPREGKGAIEFY